MNSSITPETNTRVLITGASGFLGRHLVKYLQSSGWEIAALSRPAQPVRPGGSSGGESGVPVFPYLGDYESIKISLEKFQPQAVLHLAGFTATRHSPANVASMIESNLLFGTLLAEAMCNCGIRYLVNTGTSHQHYHSDEYHPVSLYGATKQAFEDILLYYVEACGLNALTLKLVNTYGSGEEQPRILHALLKTLQTGETLKATAGEQQMDFTHVDDVVRAYAQATELLLQGRMEGLRSYAVRTGKLVRIRDVVEMIEQIAGRRPKVNLGALPYHPRELMTPWRGEILPGWESRVSLEDGLRQLLSTYAANGSDRESDHGN